MIYQKTFVVNKERFVFVVDDHYYLNFYPEKYSENEWKDDDRFSLTDSPNSVSVMRKVVEVIKEYVFSNRPPLFFIWPNNDQKEKRFHLYQRLVNTCNFDKLYNITVSGYEMFFYKKQSM